jgi:hypothetical protein
MINATGAFAVLALLVTAACTANVENPNVNQQGRGGNTCVTSCDDSHTSCVAKCTDDACKVTCQTTHDHCVASCAPADGG